MRSIRPVLNLLALTWWKWARRELTSWCPMHPDLPYVIRKVHELENPNA